MERLGAGSLLNATLGKRSPGGISRPSNASTLNASFVASNVTQQDVVGRSNVVSYAGTSNSNVAATYAVQSAAMAGRTTLADARQNAFEAYPDIDFMPIRADTEIATFHVMERTSNHVKHGEFWMYREPNGSLFQPRGLFAILYPTRDFFGRRGLTDDDCDNDFEYPADSTNVQRSTFTGKQPGRKFEQEDVRTFAQYHYIIQARPNCIRNWYSHRHYHNGCNKCRDYTTKLCRNCGYRLHAKPINDLIHLQNVVAYIKRKRDLAEVEPDVDPTPREGEQYDDESEQHVLAKLAGGIPVAEMDHVGTSTRSDPPKRFKRAGVPCAFEAQ